MKPTLEQQSPTADEVARAIEWADSWIEAHGPDAPEMSSTVRHMIALVAAAKGADAKDAALRGMLHVADCEGWYTRHQDEIDEANAALAAKESPHG